MRRRAPFQTTHELADHLIALGQVLRSFPDMRLGLPTGAAARRPRTRPAAPAGCQELMALGREGMKRALESCTVRQLREMARAQGISLGTRRRKDELVARLLWSCFDYGLGHEIVRKGQSSGGEDSD